MSRWPDEDEPEVPVGPAALAAMFRFEDARATAIAAMDAACCAPDLLRFDEAGYEFVASAARRALDGWSVRVDGDDVVLRAAGACTVHLRSADGLVAGRFAWSFSAERSARRRPS